MTKKDFIAWFLLHRFSANPALNQDAINAAIMEAERIAETLDEEGYLYKDEDDDEGGEEVRYAHEED